jgi:hypothetical protein
MHDNSSKKAKLSSATTPFPWNHTNTSKNHGYNAVADDSRRQPFRAEDSAPAPDKVGQKVRKGENVLDHTYPTSRPRGRCVHSLVEIGSEMWICIRYKQTNIQLYIYKMTLFNISLLLCIGLLSVLFPSHLPIRTLYVIFFSHISEISTVFLTSRAACLSQCDKSSNIFFRTFTFTIELIQ